jgi:TDG/mug DNA glycosylase family protein
MKVPTPPDIATLWKPSRQQLLDAVDKTLPDLVAPGLRVLFVGINPGLDPAAVGHHFARPGNRFWPALFAGGFTPRLFSPFEEHLLLPLGYGITNVVARATATADQLTPDELRAGGRALRRKLVKYRPHIAAVVGVGAYRVAFDRPRAVVGRQPDDDRIGETILWLLPNPSGLNAHYQPAELKKVFAELHDFAERLA